MKQRVFLLLLALGTLLLVPGCAQLAAASPDEDGTIEIVMDDYTFSPDVIRLQAGQTVTLRLRNEGEKMHEFMAGRDPQIHENLTEGFGEDFFAGLDLEIEGPGMVMGLEGEGMAMEGMEMETDEHDEEMEMGGMGTEVEDAMEEMPEEHEGAEMEMDEAAHEEEAGAHDEGGEEHADEMEMDSGADDTMAEMTEAHEGEEMEMDEAGHEEGAAESEETADHEEEEGEHEEEEGIIAGRFGAVQRPLMDAHAGVMIMIDPQMIAPGEETTVTFTVPAEKAGRWEFGCFQELGQHYDDGMNGLIIVES